MKIAGLMSRQRTRSVEERKRREVELLDLPGCHGIVQELCRTAALPWCSSESPVSALECKKTTTRIDKLSIDFRNNYNVYELIYSNVLKCLPKVKPASSNMK